MIFLSLSLLSLTFAVHGQGRGRVPGPPSAFLIVGTWALPSLWAVTDTLQWPWMWSPGTAKLQAHPGLLQYHLTGGWEASGWEGLLSSAASSVSFRDEVCAQASSYQEANESLCRKSGLFVLYSEEQNSNSMGKNPSTWSWCPTGAKQRWWAVQEEILCCWRCFPRFHC